MPHQRFDTFFGQLFAETRHQIAAVGDGLEQLRVAATRMEGGGAEIGQLCARWTLVAVSPPLIAMAARAAHRPKRRRGTRGGIAGLFPGALPLGRLAGRRLVIVGTPLAQLCTLVAAHAGQQPGGAELSSTDTEGHEAGGCTPFVPTTHA